MSGSALAVERGEVCSPIPEGLKKTMNELELDEEQQEALVAFINANRTYQRYRFVREKGTDEKWEAAREALMRAKELGLHMKVGIVAKYVDTAFYGAV